MDSSDTGAADLGGTTRWRSLRMIATAGAGQKSIILCDWNQPLLVRTRLLKSHLLYGTAGYSSARKEHSSSPVASSMLAGEKM